MANGPEKKVEDKIKKELKDRGAFVFKHFATGHNEKGLPDLHSVYEGYPVYFTFIQHVYTYL